MEPAMQPQVEPWEQMALACVDLLKNSRELFKLVIASDSMVAVDQKQERADNADLLQSTGSFFNQMKDMINEYPPMAKFAITLQERVARNYKGGKEVEAMYTDMIEQVAQIAEQKMTQAAQQPPDPVMVKAQSDMQIAQLQAQGKQTEVQAAIQKTQIEMQIEQVKAQMETQAMQMKAQIEQSKQALDTWKAQQDVLIADKKIQVDILKVQATTEVEKANQQIAIMQTNIAATIDALRLQMDKKDGEFQRLAQVVDAHHRSREHLDNHLAELASIVNSPTTPDRKQKVENSIRHYKFLKDANGEIVGAKASNKPEEPGSLKG